MNTLTQRLEKMLEAGSDNLLLRFGLGKAYAELRHYDQAIAHLERAVLFDAMHSSSWFWLGRAQYEHGSFADAQNNLNRAVQVASERKDSQTVKMAQVFLRRIAKLDTPGQSERA